MTWPHSSGSHPTYSEAVAAERRITTLEVTQDQHGRRLDRLELGQPTPRSSSKWQPRDYMTAGAGLAILCAAILEKVGWTHALAGLVKLFGK
jgi:hypothetical protein